MLPIQYYAALAISICTLTGVVVTQICLNKRARIRAETEIKLAKISAESERKLLKQKSKKIEQSQ